MNSLLNNLEKWGSNLTYTNTIKPIYRGILYNEEIIDSYKVGEVKIWTGFTSSSKEPEVAIKRSRDNENSRKALIFKIYVSDCNSFPTNIDTDFDIRGQAWSDYPYEKEVLIMPNFVFTTLQIDQNDPEMTTIVVAEIPY